MINELDAKTLNVPLDKEKVLHAYEVTYHLVNGETLNFTINNIPSNRKEVLSAICTDRFLGIYDEFGVNVQDFSNDEAVCINMNLVTHFNVKEITNDTN
jgi:phenylalanine-4-hydroxylase